MSESPESQPQPDDRDSAPIDRPFTYAVTVASLLVGIILSAIAGLIIYGFARPSSLGADGKMTFTLSSVFFPLAALVSAAILFWSIFNLPVRIARRKGVILDPEVWPWTGAVLIAVVVVVGFVIAMLTGVI